MVFEMMVAGWILAGKVCVTGTQECYPIRPRPPVSKYVCQRELDLMVEAFPLIPPEKMPLADKPLHLDATCDKVEVKAGA